MSQAPAVITGNDIVAQLDDSLLALMAEDMEALDASFSPSFAMLKYKNGMFILKRGGSEEIIPPDKCYIVPVKWTKLFCEWYAKQYSVGQEPGAPDLVWFKDHGFPASLPESQRGKRKDVNANWYQLNQRTVCILYRFDVNGRGYLDFDNPFVFDITGASLYGKDNAQQGIYKWNGLKQRFDQISPAGRRLSPIMCLIKVIPDAAADVPCVCFQPVCHKGTLDIQFFPPDVISKLLAMRGRPDVIRMAEVKVKLEWGAEPEHAPVAAPAPASPERAVFTGSIGTVTADDDILFRAQSALEAEAMTPDLGPGEVATIDLGDNVAVMAKQSEATATTEVDDLLSALAEL